MRWLLLMSRQLLYDANVDNLVDDGIVLVEVV